MLTETLQRVADARGGVLGVEPRLVIEPDSSWTPVTELLREPYATLLGLIDETAARWNAPRHVGAALFWKTYSYWHTMPMALGWALDGRVPIMRPADTYFKVSDAGVTIAATRVTWSEGAAAIREALAESQAPLVRAVGAVAKVGERTLWGSTAEALAHPLTSIVPGDYMRLLKEIGPPVDGLIEPAGDGYFRRTCCLWITLPDVEPCGSCCVLRPPPRRPEV
ncbi:(2Fe-2S)-binding protein [Nonomuraea jabiensis]|uniref:Ferric iron reductase protein FhuF n=1 Tax=Nonomuraea jabiensis TaxID=882448 RepID=A0A7W9L841_9ACTN|nr:(2Fe-2S)-binding protein [Nonomuraea jabiensis]MBB5774162.1 ferric iron reductase protein FhuF [Nonomuraea jabiensis]